MSEKNSVLASLFVLTLILEVCSATWSTTPGPYYQRFNDGSYNYGYSAGGGFSARQSGTAANEVSGQFSQLLPDGKLVNVRYNAGVGGFRPQVGGGLSTTARPYGFSYNTGDAFHQAAADQSGNVRGNYWYRDPTGGRHDLRYRAGPGIGFVPTGGSLAVPNGLGRRSPFGDPSVNAFGDDRYSYVDPEASGVGGIHDPNGANSRSPAPTAGTIHHGDGPATGDRSYNFGYRTPDSVRQEGSDGRGNVHGSYAFRNGGGNHDLAYVAGPGIGFQPTGGTLARPNGLGYGGGAFGNDGGRVGSGVTRPTLGSSGGINNAGAINGHSGLGHDGVGHHDPSYSGGGLGNVGASGVGTAGPGSGLSRAGGTPGLTGTGLRTRGGAFDGDAASGHGSTGGFGQGLNSVGTNVGVGSGDRTLASGLAGRTGDGSTGTGLGQRSTTGGGQIGVHGHNLANPNAARGFGGQGYGAGGPTGGSSDGINRSGANGHYDPDYSLIGNGRGQNAGSAGGHRGLGGSRREGIDYDGGNANVGIGSRGNGAYGGGFGVNGQSGDHQRLGAGSSGTGGYSYGTPSGSSAGGSGTFGSSGSGSSGVDGGGHSAGLSVDRLQSTGSGLQSSGSGSSSGSGGAVVSGEQNDFQRGAEPVQSIQTVGGGSATKGISQ
ncbi:glycine-rich cell wall structural protein 1.8 [Culex quinquefasciatus]|uniref:glycine-rich cell wall structural protein 1.8 n=1 Tax=Culex quinquefasciatus TaxID=7176 RepID=UPI0018E3209C|nr:glycine-rich cell wall structural protein 1.8 [Culex quinquefasciatus]